MENILKKKYTYMFDHAVLCSPKELNQNRSFSSKTEVRLMKQIAAAEASEKVILMASCGHVLG